MRPRPRYHARRRATVRAAISIAAMKTYVATPTDRERNWLLVDAEGQTLGRLATQIADALRGKRKPTYTPHIDTGDFVVVVNAEKISVTGAQARRRRCYYRHSGYPGGLKSRTLNDMLERRPEEVIRLAVQRHAAPQPPRPQAAHEAQGLRRPRASARGAAAATDGADRDRSRRPMAESTDDDVNEQPEQPEETRRRGRRRRPRRRPSAERRSSASRRSSRSPSPRRSRAAAEETVAEAAPTPRPTRRTTTSTSRRRRA